MRAVVGLVLALQAMGDLGGQAPERFVAGIDDEPVAANGARAWRIQSSSSLYSPHAGTRCAGPKKAGKCTQAPGSMQSRQAPEPWPAPCASVTGGVPGGYPPIIRPMPMESGRPARLCAQRPPIRPCGPLFAPAQRPVVQPPLPLPSPLPEAERRASAALMRVNHAGEIAAQALYHGQAAASRSAAHARVLLRAAAQEEPTIWPGARRA